MKEMDLSIPYYEDLSRLNNSSIGVFLKRGPLALKELLDGKGESLSLPALETGTMIHEYILQPEEFWKDYIIHDFEIPKVKQQKELLDEYHRLMEIDPFKSQDEIKLAAYKKAYKNKKSNDKCIEEAEGLIMVYQDYLEYLSKSKDNKKVISFADLNTLKKIKQNIEEHKKASELLFNMSEDWECHNEFHINWELHDVQCKSLLDRVCFNFKDKKVILIDLKTTPNVYDFEHSIEEFDYFRQLSFYGMAIVWYLENIKELDSTEFDFEVYIIAIGKDKNNQIRVFNMNKDYILKQKAELITNTIKAIKYHLSSNNWEHSKEYYDSTGIEEIFESY